jgi:hypothetical protein
MSLQAKLRDPQQFLLLYGTTPPHQDSSAERVVMRANQLARQIEHLPLDGLLVYDVQDEQVRTSVPRPFPFRPAIEPRAYARLLQQATGHAAIAYKCVVDMTEGAWRQWLHETHVDYGLRCLTLVGSASPNPRPGSLPVDRAYQIATETEPELTLGGIVIAERHAPDCDESRRLICKAGQGCRYFVSQLVFDADLMIRLLDDYARRCRRQGIAPQRIVLTFAPCGRPRTMEFIKWLGVAVPPQIESAILEAEMPLRKSQQINCESLRAILEHEYETPLPLGINIESVSSNQAEQEASVELVAALAETARTCNNRQLVLAR